MKLCPRQTYRERRAAEHRRELIDCCLCCFFGGIGAVTALAFFFLIGIEIAPK